MHAMIITNLDGVYFGCAKTKASMSVGEGLL